MAQRLETAVNEHLPPGVEFYFDVVDFKDDEPGMQNAVVIGLTAGNVNLVNETFSPEMPADDFGILDLQTDFNLYAGGMISLGFGVDLEELTEGDASRAPFMLVIDPEVANPSLVKTGLSLNVGFDGSFIGGIGFGSLDLVAADARLSLLAAENETLTVEGRAVTLAGTPINEDERFVIVYDGTSVISSDDFEISGSTLAFSSPPAEGSEITVEYQTATVPGGGVDRAANRSNRATVLIDFDDSELIITDNSIGAVPLVDLFGGSGPSLQIDAKGLVVGTLDAEFLGNRAEGAVTL
ncbi:hypothetical protein LCGC14_2721220, partial [marine sediment metagenome]